MNIEITNRSGEKMYSGTIPTTVVLKASAESFKGENYNVFFKKLGCARHTAQIERKLDDWYIVGNLIFGGLIGYLIVDPRTGAMWKLENLHVALNTDTQATTPSDHRKFHVIAIDEVPNHLRAKLVKIK